MIISKPQRNSSSESETTPNIKKYRRKTHSLAKHLQNPKMAADLPKSISHLKNPNAIFSTKLPKYYRNSNLRPVNIITIKEQCLEEAISDYQFLISFANKNKSKAKSRSKGGLLKQVTSQKLVKKWCLDLNSLPQELGLSKYLSQSLVSQLLKNYVECIEELTEHEIGSKYQSESRMMLKYFEK